MAQRNFMAGALLLPVAAALALTFKEWSATLQPQSGSTLTGTANVRPLTTDSLVATIQVKNGEPGENKPWHVHVGGCDSTGAPIGDAGRYAPITIREDKTGESTARVKATIGAGAYSVNVHRSAADMSVIACGNLRPVVGEGQKP